MRLRHRPLLVAVPVAFAALFAGCPNRPDLDLDPPRIISVEPVLTLVPVSVSFRLTFSEPLNDKSVFREDEAATVIIVERAEVDRAFLTDFNNPPLIESRQADVVPADVVIEGGDTELVVTPVAPLRAGTAYSLLVSADVRDTSGNPLFGAAGVNETFRLDFTTDDGPPALAAHDVGSGLVVPNRKYFRLTFNQGVLGLSADSVAIEPASPAADALVPVTEAVLVSEDRSVATLVLAQQGGCERLAPGADYELVLGPGITDDEGSEMEVVRVPFTTGPSCDLQPNGLLVLPEAIPTDVAATIRFSTSKASSTEVRYGVLGGALDCLGAVPCPVLGAFSSAPVEGTIPPRYAHSVSLSGLVVGESYAFRVRAEDDTGSSATGSGSFVTAPLPEIGLNEIMGNGPSGAPSDAAGEYVELVNYGDIDIALASWSLTLGTGTDARTCAFPGDAPVLEAGDYVLIVPGSFAADFYGVDPSRTISALCRGISNDALLPITLSDDDGRPVSTFGGYLDHRHDGRSIERVAPDAPDVPDSFCYSRTSDGPTPLGENGVALRGCE